MYCGACGKPVQPTDRFCGNCGTKLEIAAAAPTATSAKAPRKPLTRKQKLIYGIGGGVIGVLGVAYLVLRMLYGPSSPAALQSDFDSALSSHSESKLKALVDPAQKDILDSTTLNAFVQSLSPDVIHHYEDEVSQLVAARSDAFTNALEQAFGTDAADDQSLHLVKTSSWLGTRWYIHFPTVDVHVGGIDGDKVDVSIGDLKLTGSDSRKLIPSVYQVKVTASNDYASETETDQLNLLNESGSFTYDPSQAMKNSLTLHFPNVDGVTVTLNGKPVENNQGQAVIVPAPQTGTVEVKANVAGVDVTGSASLQQDVHEIDLGQVLNKGIAQHALQIVYDSAASAVKAAADKKWTELTDADPKGAYAQFMKEELQTISGSLALQKVMVDPDNVQINGDQVVIPASVFVGSDSSNPTEIDFDLTLQQQPGGSDWWIESAEYSWNPASGSQDALTQTAN
jgi:hypothetical protein